MHPSVQHDPLTRARHRSFIAPRLIGSVVALAAFPIYVAMRGVPNLLEVAVFTWLMAPILVAYFLSRTGQYESAHVLSSLALTGLVTAVAAATGGIGSAAAIWLVIVPLEAALSASRRVVAAASMSALIAVGLLLFLGSHQMLPDPGTTDQDAARVRRARHRFRGALCDRSRARRRIARAHQLLAALRRGGPLSAAGPQHDRRDQPARQERRGAVRLAGRRRAVWRRGRGTAWPRPVRPRSCRRPPGLPHRARRFRRGRRGALGRIPHQARCRSGGRAAVHLGRDALPPARQRDRRTTRRAKWSP